MRRALATWKDSPDKDTSRRFSNTAEPLRQELLRHLNPVPQVTGQLVAMRADLLSMAQKDSALAALNYDLPRLVSSWFNRGFLVLRPISWDDLRRRLEPPDQRCFAFFIRL